MAEGQSFEKQHEITPQPKIDIRPALERGEVVDSWPLEGYSRFSIVVIKDDGKGLFRSEKTQSKRKPLRIHLELLARLIDKVIGSDLIPEVVVRNIGEEKGTLQHFIENAKPISHYSSLKLVPMEEIARAALFDFLIEAADRRTENILFREDGKKIWLIDHDDLMFLNAGSNIGIYSEILNEARRRNLKIAVEGKLAESIQELISKLEQLSSNSQEIDIETLTPKLLNVINKVKQRAITVLETGAIPI